MKKIITKDNSITYFNEEHQEYYHSLSGAKEEALEKHAKPAIEFLKENNLLEGQGKVINVLDFCFGLGYNSIIFANEVLKINKDIKINITGLENDTEIITEGKKILKDIIEKHIEGDKKIKLDIRIGDACEEIEKIKKEIKAIGETEAIKIWFDVCFFDPFSPKKCPELWNEKIFKDVYQIMSKKSILTTYSCARKPRENMKKAGFIVKDGPTIGRWAPATICVKYNG